MTTFRDAHLRNSRTVFSYDRKMISFFEFLEDQKSRELQWRLISWATASWATLFWFSGQNDFIDYLTTHLKKDHKLSHEAVHTDIEEKIT